MNDSEYFGDPVSLMQISCPCGCGGTLDDRLLAVLDKVREKFGKPVNINSGFRCDRHNAEIGGVSYSSHTKGLAVDIRCINSLDRFRLINMILAYVPVKRIGIGKDFIHIDIDETKPQDVMWAY